MASAEQLLHEAQYAFSCISFGDSPDNKRNASRARSLSRKIIRKYPTTMEASEARAILRRLGDEAFTSNLRIQHRHVPQAVHHRKPVPEAARTFVTEYDEIETFDWGGFLAWLFALPKFVLAMIVLAGLFLFSIFGPLLLVFLVGFAFLSTPFRRIFKPEQREGLDTFIARANDFIAGQRG